MSRTASCGAFLLRPFRCGVLSARRISLVHYNTVEEVERIIGLLKEALA
jgi:selenocysteine lyase/cysteine desulfurase